MRIEPPPSLAWAIGNMPAGHRRRRRRPTSRPACGRCSTGCGVIPKRLFSVAVISPNSGVLVRPHSTKPARWSASTDSSLVVGDRSRRRRRSRTSPAALAPPSRSLIGIGTPRNGASSPAASRSSAARAAATRLVVVAPDDRVERRVALVDGGQARVEQLHGRELPARSAPASSVAGEDGPNSPMARAYQRSAARGGAGSSRCRSSSRARSGVTSALVSCSRSSTASWSTHLISEAHR